MAPEQLPPPEVGVGQIWIAAPDQSPGVLVLITDVSDDHVQALLCNNGGDGPGETDAVLATRITGCPHRLLVHDDLAGSIMRTRLVGSRGRIDPAPVQRIVVRGRGDGLQLVRSGARDPDRLRVGSTLGHEDGEAQAVANGEGARDRARVEDLHPEWRAQVLTAIRPV